MAILHVGPTNIKDGMNKQHIITALFITALMVGCQKRTSDYVEASSISKGGLARNAKEMRKINGQEIKIWGFVDRSNIYGVDGAKKILEDWWSGDGPNATTWSFNLKANEDDEAGHSFSVHVPNDPWRDDLLKVFLANARAQRPTKVFVKGKIFTFDAPTNFRRFTGLYMELQSSQDISLEFSGTSDR